MSGSGSQQNMSGEAKMDLDARLSLIHENPAGEVR